MAEVDRTQPPPGYRVYEGDAHPTVPPDRRFHWAGPSDPAGFWCNGCQVSYQNAVDRCWHDYDLGVRNADATARAALVSDEDVDAAIKALGLSDDDGSYNSIDREDVRRMLANDRARQAACTCGRELLTLCRDCDVDALDGMGSQ